MKFKIVRKNIFTKNQFIFADSLINLYKFKLDIDKLLIEKEYHYSILNNNVTDLINLNKITKDHKQNMQTLFTKYEINYKNLYVPQKMCFMNLSTVTLSYRAFIELLKYIHEQKEEDINNIIRDVIEIEYKDDDLNRNLIKLRDEWRDAFAPEVLNELSEPLHQLSIVDKINLEANKRLLDIMI
jgi:hypothetical protein